MFGHLLGQKRVKGLKDGPEDGIRMPSAKDVFNLWQGVAEDTGGLKWRSECMLGED